MKLGDISIKAKLTWGFGIVLVLFLGSVIWAITGIGTIVHDAEESINGNKIRSLIEARVIDHLNWESQLSQFINDREKNKLNIGLDPRKCNLGKWYYSEERRRRGRARRGGGRSSCRSVLTNQLVCSKIFPKTK